MFPISIVHFFKGTNEEEASLNFNETLNIVFEYILFEYRAL